jgi:hypothetical protein
MAAHLLARLVSHSRHRTLSIGTAMPAFTFHVLKLGINASNFRKATFC